MFRLLRGLARAESLEQSAKPSTALCLGSLTQPGFARTSRPRMTRHRVNHLAAHQMELLCGHCDVHIRGIARSADTVSTLVSREGPRRVRGDELA
jgi:hypothetical protein